MSIFLITLLLTIFSCKKFFESLDSWEEDCLKRNKKKFVSLLSINKFVSKNFSSISILCVEKSPSSNIKTASDALWWSMETITTVGYGDKYPVTDLGRIIGTILMISGVGLFGTYTAYIASLFVKYNDNEKSNKEMDE